MSPLLAAALHIVQVFSMLLGSSGFAQNEDALGVFELQRDGLPHVRDAVFLEDGVIAMVEPHRAVVFDAGTDAALVQVFGNYSAIAARSDGTLAVYNADKATIEFWQVDAANGTRAVVDSLDVGTGDIVAIAQNGDDWLVVDRAAHLLRLIGVDGEPRWSIGGKGSGEGQFAFPSDVAVDDSGRFFVADRDNHRIQRFSADGRFERAWGERGAFPGLLAAPSGVDFENGQLFVSETLNHRISVFDADGRYQYQWGMHSVVPREGEGRIHYPESIDVSDDAARAVVVEPFERRAQTFTRFAGGVAEARALELPSKTDIRSHFGPFLAANKDLLAMWEPESGSIVVFDMRGETGINITVLSNHGEGWDDLGRLGAIWIDADTQAIFLADLVNDRLQRWELHRDLEGVLKYDPFMGRLSSAVAMSRIRKQLENADTSRTWKTPNIVALARAGAEGAPLLAADEANGVLLALDDRLDPIGFGIEVTKPLGLMVDSVTGDVSMLEADGRLERLSVDGTRRAESLQLLLPESVGGVTILGDELFVSDQLNDNILVFDLSLGQPTPRAPSRVFAKSGDADGEVFLPAALGVTGRGAIALVDRGNHRVQLFGADGKWLSSFSLSSGYTSPRKKTN